MRQEKGTFELGIDFIVNNVFVGLLVRTNMLMQPANNWETIWWQVLMYVVTFCIASETFP